MGILSTGTELTGCVRDKPISICIASPSRGMPSSGGGILFVISIHLAQEADQRELSISGRIFPIFHNFPPTSLGGAEQRAAIVTRWNEREAQLYNASADWTKEGWVGHFFSTTSAVTSGGFPGPGEGQHTWTMRRGVVRSRCRRSTMDPFASKQFDCFKRSVLLFASCACRDLYEAEGQLRTSWDLLRMVLEIDGKTLLISSKVIEILNMRMIQLQIYLLLNWRLTV